jgi:uncharacterized protein YcfL
MKKQSIIILCIAIAGSLVMVSCGSNNAEKATEKNAVEMQPNLPADSTATVADSLSATKSASKENKEKDEKEADEKDEKK